MTVLEWVRFPPVTPPDPINRGMKHYLYKVTNLLNDHFYIGMHSTNDPNDDYLGSGKRIRAEVRKYGRENFKKEILEEHPSRLALFDREAEIVNDKLLANPLCLNLKNGGEGGWDIVNNNSKLQREKAIRGNEVQKQKRIDDPAWFARKIAKQRATQIHQYESGVRKPGWMCTDGLNEMTKRAQSDKACLKRQQTFTERKHQQGEKNSQFGTCWITDGVKAIKIPKNKLDEYLSLGYVRGRKRG